MNVSWFTKRDLFAILVSAVTFVGLVGCGGAEGVERPTDPDPVLGTFGEPPPEANGKDNNNNKAKAPGKKGGSGGSGGSG